jgi:hypothetical protein
MYDGVFILSPQTKLKGYQEVDRPSVRSSTQGNNFAVACIRAPSKCKGNGILDERGMRSILDDTFKPFS